MMIRFTKHAEEKFALLRRHGVSLSRKQVIGAVMKPEQTDYSRLPLFIAQSSIDAHHVLRVVYKQDRNTRTIITFYPGRKYQYAAIKHKKNT